MATLRGCLGGRQLRSRRGEEALQQRTIGEVECVDSTAGKAHVQSLIYSATGHSFLVLSTRAYSCLRNDAAV